nr:bidirectional sugar transporter SWEET6b-like [Ziziphus jujuba var. spinosa]
MVNTETGWNIVGIIGNVISLGLFISPVPTFYNIRQKKDVEEFQPYPYIAAVLNCLFWMLYGMPFVHPNSLLVLTVTPPGLLLEFIYISIFFVYAPNNGRKKIVVGLGIVFIFNANVVAITLLTLHEAKIRSFMVGMLCDIFNLMMYISPLTIMAKVINTKSVKYMPFYLSLANFLNGASWTSSALIKFDIYVLVSNGLAAISGAIQLILYACYYKTTPKNNKNDIENNAVQLSTTHTPKA